MLVAQGNFQEDHFFAQALETEMARLDYAGVYGADGDLVGGFVLNAQVVGNAGQDIGAFAGLWPGEAYGLGPWVVFADQTGVFGDLAFEPVKGRAVRA